jgi:hypothetical protein
MSIITSVAQDAYWVSVFYGFDELVYDHGHEPVIYQSLDRMVREDGWMDFKLRLCATL